ncbi:MAG: hypothetical protein ACI9WU_003651 [Myxococcota bacterium]|jgi:hypothetical protein
MNRKNTILLATITLALASGCETYDPPPKPNLTLPEGGVYEVGDPIELTFSEPIDKTTVSIRVWAAGPDDRTIEDEFTPGLAPEVTCSAAEGVCGNTTLTLSDDARTLTIGLADEQFQKAKVPWTVEVLEGLTDLKGQKTGAPYRFDFQFAPPSTCGGGDEVSIRNGRYFFWGTVQDPLPVTLLLYMDIEVLPTGALRLVGFKATPIEGAAKNTKVPEELELDMTNNAFALHLDGCVTNDGDTVFLSTDAKDVELLLGGAIRVVLVNTRITGTVVGGDVIEGTLSFSELIIDSGEPFSYEAGNAAIFLFPLEDNQWSPGAGDLCGDLCGEVPQQCTPPEAWPGEGFCAAE